jgi:hypothetical protein
MRGRGFESLMSEALGRGRADLETRSLALRRAGLWPSGRGRYGPALDRDALAAGLLAHFAASKPSHAVTACVAFGDLVEQVTLGRRLVKVLSSLLMEPEEARAVRFVLLNRTRLSAQIVLRDGTSRLFLPKSVEDEATHAAFDGAGEAGLISGALLERLALDARASETSLSPQEA